MKPYVVGIAGGSASGKTTLAKELEEALQDLKVKTFHMDSYFKPDSTRPKAAALVTGKVYYDDNCPETIDHEKMKADFLSALEEGWEVILVEGLLTLWYDWLFERLDFKLFVDCQADERIVRRLRRNMAERGLSFDEIAEVYLDMVRYRHQQYVEPSKWRADLILNGSSPSGLAVSLIVEQIRKSVQAESSKRNGS